MRRGTVRRANSISSASLDDNLQKTGEVHESLMQLADVFANIFKSLKPYERSTTLLEQLNQNAA